MAKIVRKNQKIFASSPGGNQLGKIGSLAAGSVSYTNDIETMQELPQFLAGLYGILVAGNSPATQDFNSLFNICTYQLAYLFQSGIPEWNTSTEYYTDSLCISGGVIYISNADNNSGNAVSDETWWRPYSNEPAGSGKDFWGSSLPRGWVWADGKTIGNASSNASGRANADTFSLYSLLWTAGTDTTLPIYTSAGVLSSRSGSAASDFAANKAITIPDKRGRASVGKDDLGGTAASRITSATMSPNGTTVGANGGTQTHTLISNEMPSHGHSQNLHTHNVSLTSSGQSQQHVHDTTSGNNLTTRGVTGGPTTAWFADTAGTPSTGVNNVDHTHTVNGNTGNQTDIGMSLTGGGAAHLNMQPSIICNYIIKL